MDISEIDLKGKYVIMKTKAALNLDIIDRVYFCDSGFGCDPRKSGTKIFGHFVTDPEKVYMRRYDAITLATDDEVKQAQERFRNNKTWGLENWRDLDNESICVKCGNADGTQCIAGRADTLQGMVITKCPDFTTEQQTKAITIHEAGIRDFLAEYYGEIPTDERIKEFIEFLERDVEDWIKENWDCFLDQQASEGVKKLMDSVSEG